jgi:hypothetical protein
MRNYLLLMSAAGLLMCAGAGLAQDADTVDGFDAYSTPHANALLALNGSARMSGSVIADNSIPGSRLVPGAVTAGRLGNNSVTTDKISDGQVMSADLAAGAVTRTKIANSAVTTTRIADQAVTGGKLAYGAVTAGRLADNSVTTSKIADGAVRGEDVGIPLLIGGNRDGYLIGCFNSSCSSASSGITGYSLGTFGYTRGVVGACQSPAGTGVYGVAKAATGGCVGVYGESQSTYGFGVYGYASSSSPSGTCQGVYARVDAGNGSAVFGLATAASGQTHGVYGYSSSTSGTGVRGVAAAGSGTTYGVFGTTGSASGYGVYSSGNAYVDGDLTITGSKGGYVTDLILNGGEEPLYPGDLVEILSYAEPVLGEIPVAVVVKTTEAESTAVLGPIDCSVRIAPNEDVELAPGAPREAARCHVRRTAGAIAPGGYGKVVTLGLFKRINVDASYGPIYPGDLLVSSPTPGCAMACDDPGVGTVVGKALGTLAEGAGEIPVFVSPR